MTKPEAPRPAKAPRDIIETDPRAAAFEGLAVVEEVDALSAMPEGVVPSVGQNGQHSKLPNNRTKNTCE